MNLRERQRKHVINRIVKTLEEIKAKGVKIDEKKFIEQICAEYGCSVRLSKEYLDIGKSIYSQKFA